MTKYEEAVQAIQEGHNTFVTGSAGVGKSHLINANTDSHTALSAPTGIASLNIGGVTCSKLFKLPNGLVTTRDWNTVPRDVNKIFSNNTVKRIIIDEVGMLRADKLDLIDHRLKLIKGNDKPFGGIQMIVVGDFYQLESIVNGSEYQHYFKSYKTPFAFSAKSWDFKTVELTHVYRQSNLRQVKMLNSIRKGDKWCGKALELIQKEAKPYKNTENTLHLCCYKADAANINAFWYDQRPGKEHVYTATKTGKPDESWSECPVEEIVRLKEGCRVVICANHVQGEYVNGNKGVILKLDPVGATVELSDGRIVYVEPNTWDKHSYNTTGGELSMTKTATLTQLPLMLGYACSIHKAQGITITEAALYIGNGCFSHGQCYTGFSRIEDLRNLSFVTPVTLSDIIVRKAVREFYGDL